MVFHLLAQPAFGADVARPNFLLIITDQQTGDALSCAGNPHVKTPNLDSLAARGMRFDRSFCTYPLCTPSRASLFTSRMPHEVGITRNGDGSPLPADVISMGLVFKDAGYETAYAGKWHLPTYYPAHAVAQTNRLIPGFAVLPLAPLANKSDMYIGLTVDAGVIAASTKFLQQRHVQPFVLVVSIMNPHDICDVLHYPEKYSALQPSQAPLPPTLPNYPAISNEPDPLRRKREKSANHWTEQQWQEYRAIYYRLVEIADGHIGRVLSCLEDNGLANNTVVIFTSDHGEMMGAHQQAGKSSLYKEALDVPLIIRAPGVTEKATVNSTHLVSGLDLLPTMCDFAGISQPASFRGRSLRPLLEGRSPAWRNHVVAELAEGRMVRSASYKYILYEQGGNREQFFDLRNDPQETQNLIADASVQAALEEHRRWLQAYIKETQDEFGTPERVIRKKK